MKTIATVAASVLATLIVAPGMTAQAAHHDKPRPSWAEKPCKYEDSTNCLWDASVRGNGVGHSFYVREINGLTCVMYVSKKFAKKNDACWDGEGEVSPR